MSDYIDEIVRDVMRRDSRDLPEGAKALVMAVKLAEVIEENRPRKTYYFPGDWKPKDET